jgi:hypothetical protein
MKIIETKPKTNNMSRETWKYLYKRLGEIANPQLSALRNFLEAPFQMVFSDTETSQQKVYNLYMSVLQLKLDGMSKEPSPIEKTMTRAQLFLCNNPLWTKGLRPISIKTILAEYNRLKNIGSPDVIVPIINKTITKYGTIDYRRLKEIRKEHNIA